MSSVPAVPPALYESTAENFAPLAPLLAQVRGDDLKPANTLQQAFQAKYKWHKSIEKRVWDEMYLTGYEIANFIEGRQFIRPNPWAPGTYLAYVPRTQNEANKRSLNLMRFYASNAMWKWQLSNPDIVAVAGVDTEQARESAKAADLIIEHYEREFFKPQLTIKEALHALCWGTYIWRIRYDDSKKSVTAEVPIYGDQQVSLGEGYGQCADCGVQGTAQDFPPDETGQPTCPECGGPAQVQQVNDTLPGVIGTQQIELGEITAELLPFPECRWDINKRAEESSWFIHERRAAAVAIRRLLGNVKFPAFDDQNFGLTIVERLAYAGQSGGGQARADYKQPKIHEEPVVVVEYSLGPDDIADIVLASPEETVGGQTIPAGPLLNTFPHGLTVQGINGLNVITGVFAEHHSEYIAQGVWHSRTTAGVGQGFNDLVEVQKRFNSDDSQVHTFLRAVGTPGMLFRQEAIGDQDRMDYIGDPKINIAVNSQNLPEGMRLEDIVRPAWQPQSVPGQLFNYTYERLNDFAQLTSHITDFSGGLPNVNNRTATGAQISQANSNALFTPPLQIKGEVRQRIAELVLDLFRKHFPTDRYFPLKGKYGRQQGRYLSAANVGVDIRLEVTKDSELPRNSFTKREDFMTMFTMLGGAQGLLALEQQSPELALEVQRNFNIQLGTDTYDHVASLCQQRIQQMSDVSQLAGPMLGMLPSAPQPQPAAPPANGEGGPQPPAAGGMAAPMLPSGPEVLIMAIQPPIALEEPDHDKKAKYLSEWLDTDEGQQADPTLRQAVILLIQTHFQLFAQVTMAMGALTMMANPQPPPEEGGGGESSGPPKKDSGAPDTGPPNTAPNRPITGRPAPKGARP